MTHPPPANRGELSILLLEDSPLDAELTSITLAKGGVRASIRRAETREQFVAAMNNPAPLDLILADYALPSFDGLSALDLARVARPEVPFLFLSGVIGQEVAIESLKRGATDYVLKDRLDRLVPAVARAMAESRERAERRRAEAELRKSEERLRLASEAARFGTWEWDLASGAIECSASHKANLGLAPEATLTHESLVASIHPDDRERVLAGLDRAVASGEDYSSEHRVRWPDGTTHWILVRGRLYEGGRTPQMIGVTLDIDAQKQTESDLTDADRRKDQFLAMLAHELRNPLAPLRNGLEIIRLASDNGKMVRVAQGMMDRQLMQLTRLVDDLLDLSRITRGTVDLRIEEVELAPILLTAVETSRSMIDAGRHELAVSIPPGPLPLRADPVRLAQVFSNLLNNAAKYTDTGGHIRLSARRDGEEVLVSVEDDGVGIPADILPRVFEMFVQVDRTLVRAQGGLGIGLTLVKSLVELHGGRVTATSGPGRGSEFEVRLPCLQVSPDGPPAHNGSAGAGPAHLRPPAVDLTPVGAP